MEHFDHNFWIEFIVSDYLPLTVNDKNLFLSLPSRPNRFLAERFFLDTYQQSIEEGLLTEEQIEELLNKHKIWNNEKQKIFDGLLLDIEKIKLNMYENWMAPEKLKDLRKALNTTKDVLEKYYIDKSVFNGFSAKSVAQYCKQHFLTGCSIYTFYNKPYWKNPIKCWNKSDEVLHGAYLSLNKYMLNDSDFRELARSAAWRGIWSVKKSGNLFGKPIVDLTNYQRQLIVWTNMYDSVYKHSECPDEVVINDDDLLDGWMLHQKKKRDLEQNKTRLENMINPKIWNSEEVFILMDDKLPIAGDNEKKFDVIYNMNDATGKAGFHRRMNQIKRDGYVDESNMIDRRLTLQGKLI